MLFPPHISENEEFFFFFQLLLFKIGASVIGKRWKMNNRVENSPELPVICWKKNFLHNDVRQVNGRNMTNGEMGEGEPTQPVGLEGWQRASSCLPTPTCCYLCALFLFIISQRLENRPSGCFPFLKRDYVGFWRWNGFVASLRTACVWEAKTAGEIRLCWYECLSDGILQVVRAFSVQTYAKQADVVNCSFSRLRNEWKQHVWWWFGRGRWVAAACRPSSLSVNTNAYTCPCCPSAFPALQGVCCICLSAGVPEGV